jgi:hypothetical protein
VDKLEQIGHLVVAALSKARELNKLALDSESKRRLAELVKRAKDSHASIRALEKASAGNGKGLDKETLDAALDELIETFQDVNKKLDELLAKARG